MTGNANEQLSFCGPSGRVMVSRPSPMWTAVTGRAAAAWAAARAAARAAAERAAGRSADSPPS